MFIKFSHCFQRPKLPWRELLTSIPIYALSFAMFGRYWAVSQFWIVHSTFLGTILHYSIGQVSIKVFIFNVMSFIDIISDKFM